MMMAFMKACYRGKERCRVTYVLESPGYVVVHRPDEEQQDESGRRHQADTLVGLRSPIKRRREGFYATIPGMPGKLGQRVS